MTPVWGRLGRVPLRFPFEILRRLHEAAAAQRSDTSARLPRVRLEIATRSQSYDGSVLAIEERNDGVLVLFRGEGLTYLHLGTHEPISITVYDPEDHLALLGGDAAVRWSSDDPLGALEARRALADLSARLAQVNVALDTSAALVAGAHLANNNARDLAGALVDWWIVQGADPVGAAAIAGLKRVLFRTGESTVAREGDTLVIGIGKKGYDDVAAFVSALESAL